MWKGFRFIFVFLSTICICTFLEVFKIFTNVLVCLWLLIFNLLLKRETNYSKYLIPIPTSQFHHFRKRTRNYFKFGTHKDNMHV